MAKDLTPVPFAQHPCGAPKGDGCLLAKVNALREVQSTGGDATWLRPLFGPLWALMRSILDKAFKGEP